MSVAERLHTARSRLSPATWSLGTKLVATVVGLFLAVTLATASLTVVLLNHYLLGQLDQGVRASAMALWSRSARMPNPSRISRTSGFMFQNRARSAALPAYRALPPSSSSPAASS